MKVNGVGAAAEERNGDVQANLSSMNHVTTASEIRSALDKLKLQESNVTTRLKDLIASQKDLNRELGKLDIVRAQLGSQAVATRSISNSMLSDAAATAQKISSAVQILDLEQSRVKATLEVVEQVSELKACVHGVVGSMGAPQDWETAAGYLSRAAKIPEEIVKGAFAEETVPSIEIPDPPSVTLNNAAESLRGLFLREFDKATKEDNGAKITRFFKLFPLIGHSDTGLSAYGRYVCQGVAAHARENLNPGTGGLQGKEGFFYPNALSKLFEYIAQIVDRHGSLVERHYGKGRMVKVIERLQDEADVQGGIIIDTWSEERRIDRKLTDIKSYAFTFLVQSFLPTQQPSRNPVSRTGSPAVFDREAIQKEDDGVDMREVDALLGESGMMLGRWSLYCRFIGAKCVVRVSNYLSVYADRYQESPEEPEKHSLAFPDLLTNSLLLPKVNDRLIAPFNQMTTFYFRRSVEKAFQLDEQPQDLSLNMSKPLPSNAPYITSAVDDVMYIVNQVLQRTLGTSQRSVITSVVPMISRILSADFIGMEQRKMRDESYPKPAVQGGLPPEHIIVTFLVLLNNLDISADYIKRIVSSRLDISLDDLPQPNPSEVPTTPSSATFAPPPSNTLISSFPFNNDAVLVSQILYSLHTTFYTKAAELLADGIFVIFRNVMKPRLRPILLDTFRDVDYALSSSEIDELNHLAENPDDSLTTNGTGPLLDNSGRALGVEEAVPARFQTGWDALHKPLRRILTDANWQRLLRVTASYLAEMLEKRIWGYFGKMNALGASRLERDIDHLVAAIVRGGGKYALRDEFARCTQICLVMTMEEEEWEELREDDKALDIEWKIDAEEKARARSMARD